MNGVIWPIGRLATDNCDDPYFDCGFDDVGNSVGAAAAIVVIVVLVFALGIVAAVVRSSSGRSDADASPGERHFAEEERPSPPESDDEPKAAPSTPPSGSAERWPY